MGWISIALLLVKLWALVDAVLRPAAAFPAADKLTKAAWLWILGLAFVVDLVLASMFLMLAGTIAAFVYLLDVRPAVASLTRRR
ncbi:DUF2516 family protein [Nocardioides pocheonensis]|uniref:DUF2516 family protein n=2 Tax=Nocardioides pocheonensis TaxID=661485 RepID=A0A3N0GZJ4_9ACTN|nr:DUF2516 family protein [Nocardioides pocheonensis]